MMLMLFTSKQFHMCTPMQKLAYRVMTCVLSVFSLVIGIIPYLITLAVNYIISIEVLKQKVEELTLSMPRKFTHSMQAIFQKSVATEVGTVIEVL